MFKEKTAFTKENSAALKGIAILMMVFHHCFADPSRYEAFSTNFAPFGEHWVCLVSYTFKMCVSLFAFVTGFGLYLSLKGLNKENNWSRREIVKWTTTRYIKTMSGFWFIAVIAYIVCQLINGYTYDSFFTGDSVSDMVLGLFRMGLNFFGIEQLFYGNEFCPTWWYMTIAVLFIVAAPIFVKLFDKFSVIPVLAVAFFLPRVLQIPYDSSTYIAFQFPFLFGMIAAKYNILPRVANYKWIRGKLGVLNKPVKFIVMFVLCFVCIYIYKVLPAKYYYELRFSVFPMVLIFFAYEFLLDLVVLRKVLEFLGKHSMNIFLTHTFIRYNYCNEFIYSFKYWWLIPLVLICVSLALSIVIELVKKLIRYDLFTKQLLKMANKGVDKMFDSFARQ